MLKFSKCSSKTKCPAPFNSTTITATGRWAICSESNPDYSFPGGYQKISDTKSVDDWFRSDYMNNVRKAMIEGKKLKECTLCYKNEDIGLKSPRQFKIQQDDPDMLNPGVKFLDIKFGNKCNLKCKMCSPHYSSELMKEWRDLKWTSEDPFEGQRADQYNGYFFENYDWPRQQENIDKLLQVTDKIKILKFTGGEPMINPQFFKFMKHCIDKGTADSIVLYVTTNCTKIHPKFLELASAFKELNLRLSIDGFGPTYDYIRYPADWNMVYRNILRYSDWYRKKVIKGKIIIHSVLMVFNVHQICELLKLVRPNVDGIEVRELEGPAFMHWRHAPEQTIKRFFKSVIDMMQSPDKALSIVAGELLEILKSQHMMPSKDSRKLLSNFVNQQDKLRKINISTYIPGLVQITESNFYNSI